MPWLGLWFRVLTQTRQPAFSSGVLPFQSEWQPGGGTECRSGETDLGMGKRSKEGILNIMP